MPRHTLFQVPRAKQRKTDKVKDSCTAVLQFAYTPGMLRK